MDLLIFICAAVQLVFVLLFCITVTDKLKRTEYLTRELLRTANPYHSEFKGQR
jgi:hypothetical protein